MLAEAELESKGVTTLAVSAINEVRTRAESVNYLKLFQQMHCAKKFVTNVDANFASKHYVNMT